MNNHWNSAAVSADHVHSALRSAGRLRSLSASASSETEQQRLVCFPSAFAHSTRNVQRLSAKRTPRKRARLRLFEQREHQRTCFWPLPAFISHSAPGNRYSSSGGVPFPFGRSHSALCSLCSRRWTPAFHNSAVAVTRSTQKVAAASVSCTRRFPIQSGILCLKLYSFNLSIYYLSFFIYPLFLIFLENYFSIFLSRYLLANLFLFFFQIYSYHYLSLQILHYSYSWYIFIISIIIKHLS